MEKPSGSTRGSREPVFAGARLAVAGLGGSARLISGPGGLEPPVVHEKAGRLEEGEPAAGVRGEPDDVAGIRRDLRLDQDDVEHQAGGSVRATTQFTTRAAPARFSVSASSSRVAPVG